LTRSRSDFYRDARRDLAGPLEGLRVVEATTTWAGPMCGCLLADMGADVIKVELPSGEVGRSLPPLLPGTAVPLSFMHATVNRNKRSLTLDLRRSEGRDLFRRLADRADVVVENFRPGTMQRWGLGYAELSARRPQLVYVSISGYGQFGPLSDRVGYDPIAQAASGWLSLNGEPQGAPVKAPTFLGDDVAGLHAAVSTLGALRHRDRTGEGQHIDVSLLDCLLFQSNGYPTLAALGLELPRLGSRFVVAAPAGVYRSRDGYVMLGVLLDAHWKRLAVVLGRPELAEHADYATTPARLARRDALDRLVGDWSAERSTAEIVEALTAERLPVSKVQSYADAVDDPHVQEREMLQPTELEDGTRAPLVGPAAKFSRTPTKVRHGAPALGSHGDEILAELGLDEEERQRLRDSVVV
jgi:formyl-CoA transferase